MKEEDKELLLKDLCARLPYGVIVKDRNGVHTLTPGNNEFINLFNGKCNIKPYLRPMSSMTYEEKFAYNKAQWVYQADYCAPEYFDGLESYDWLNKNHFDYRGLIEKGLAIDASGKNIY